MRGQQSLFSDIFPTRIEKAKQERPRNFYMPERNEAMLHRYYFHAEINHYRYDVCLSMLEKEFYLTSPRIVVVLNKHVDELSEIVNSKPTLRELQEKYPHFSWKAR